MKVVKRTATPKFTPIVLEITIESQAEVNTLRLNLECVANGRYNTSTTFDTICRDLLDALKK